MKREDHLAPGTCSTPFGITDEGTACHSSGRPHARVLNAFRHHG